MEKEIRHSLNRSIQYTTQLRYSNSLRALRPKKVELMGLKGAALLGTVYPELGPRPLRDVDLMIRPEELAVAEACLTESGFYRQSALNYQWQGLTLDLHIDLTSAHRIRARERLYTAVVWAGSTRGARVLAALVLGGALLAASGLTILEGDEEN